MFIVWVLLTLVVGVSAGFFAARKFWPRLVEVKVEVPGPLRETERIIERPVEKLVDRPVEVEKIVEVEKVVTVEVPVEKIVEVERVVEKEVSNLAKRKFCVAFHTDNKDTASWLYDHVIPKQETLVEAFKGSKLVDHYLTKVPLAAKPDVPRVRPLAVTPKRGGP